MIYVVQSHISMATTFVYLESDYCSCYIKRPQFSTHLNFEISLPVAAKQRTQVT